ncbi:hypothetical protein FAZ19_08480 [Sphingobacterium alkalisoli]|uniref:Outer membrane protein beta-barrel domain-containing protein n=1 Tax=Sphingobacterium alkalisoli TaxID=1874115 RepID=A0A4U0H5L2_9SPHI|nr:hypothetical protein [Sphingobacterium alkalisoli]TJY66928.1 hypothetical protein FAZ19_08480 [Sphingobacterium alkalisoli]GGH13333.1 hypothetical protein GCM10011418_13470 [Sphingobacterium alkalisoli]
MKKVILSLFSASVLTLATFEANAQAYKTALGLAIDAGDGATLFGPQIKHSFDGTNAGNAQVLFGDHVTIIGADYSYNQPFRGTNGLGWYVGVGPQIAFVDHWGDDDHAHFAVRPAAGLEYKIPTAPLAFHFDWKPWWNLSHESDFEPARFTLGFKFTLK